MIEIHWLALVGAIASGLAAGFALEAWRARREMEASVAGFEERVGKLEKIASGYSTETAKQREVD